MITTKSSPLEIAAERWINLHREKLGIPQLRLPLGTKFDGGFGSVVYLTDGLDGGGRWFYAWMQMGRYYYLLDGPGYDEESGSAMDAYQLARLFGFRGTPDLAEQERAYYEATIGGGRSVSSDRAMETIERECRQVS